MTVHLQYEFNDELLGTSTGSQVRRMTFYDVRTIESHEQYLVVVHAMGSEKFYIENIIDIRVSR